MPNQYVRKAAASRGAWSEEDMKNAVKEVQKRAMSVYRASIVFNIPRKTLERRVKHNNYIKGPMEPSSTFATASETERSPQASQTSEHSFDI